MRCYHFNNFYLSGIHAGIQSAHSQTELAIKYGFNKKQGDPKSEAYEDWAVNHKTMVVLNGGMQQSLAELLTFLDNPDNPYPWAYFCESEEALNNALTNIALVLPYHMYAYARQSINLDAAGNLVIGGFSTPLGDFIAQIHEDGDVTWDRLSPGSDTYVWPSEGIASYTSFDMELLVRLTRYKLM